MFRVMYGGGMVVTTSRLPSDTNSVVFFLVVLLAETGLIGRRLVNVFAAAMLMFAPARACAQREGHGCVRREPLMLRGV